MKKSALVLAAAAVLGSATIASAAWTIDPETGIGFVGKGDVQLALGLNNAQLQSLAGSLVFSYEDEATYDVPCMKENRAQILRETFKRSRSVTSSVAYEARQKTRQVTGFNLTGFGTTTETGGNVVCPGGWDSDGDPMLVESSGGVLTVNGVPLAEVVDPIAL